jgi:hypothetical protein
MLSASTGNEHITKMLLEHRANFELRNNVSFSHTAIIVSLSYVATALEYAVIVYSDADFPALALMTSIHTHSALHIFKRMERQL